MHSTLAAASTRTTRDTSACKGALGEVTLSELCRHKQQPAGIPTAWQPFHQVSPAHLAACDQQLRTR